MFKSQKVQQMLTLKIEIETGRKKVNGKWKEERNRETENETERNGN